MSTSSDLLDLLLQEDSRSGTGSAASGSGSSGTRSSGSGSGSNGCCSSGTSTWTEEEQPTSERASLTHCCLPCPFRQQPGQPHQQILWQHRLTGERPLPQAASRGQQQRRGRRPRGAVHQVRPAGPHLAADGQHGRQDHDDVPAARQVTSAKWNVSVYSCVSVNQRSIYNTSGHQFTT